MEVQSPNGGESLGRKAKHIITWKTSGVSGKVRIEVSTNGGSTWQVIAKSTKNDGSHKWKPGKKTSASNQALLRISSADSPSTNDVSDNFFLLF